MVERLGGCACGAVRYRVSGTPLFVHCCHCTDCQRASGSAFAVNALFEASRIALLGEAPESVETPSASGMGEQVMRCPQCRVALWSHYAGNGAAIAFLRTGTLKEPDAFPPDIHIFTRSKRPWVVVPDGVPAMEAYYKPKEMWPAESQARWKAARG
jgi:hypothetical protein